MPFQPMPTPTRDEIKRMMHAGWDTREIAQFVFGFSSEEYKIWNVLATGNMRVVK